MILAPLMCTIKKEYILMAMIEVMWSHTEMTS